MNTIKINTNGLTTDNIKDRLIYLSNNDDNLKKIELQNKERIHELLLQRLDIFKYKEGISYFLELGIDKQKIIKIKKEIFDNFIFEIEKLTNEYLATYMFDKIINTMTYESRNELNIVKEENYTTSYLLDTKRNHNIKKYKTLKTFLKTQSVYVDNKQRNIVCSSDIEDLYKIYEDEFIEFIHNAFFKVSLDVISKNLDKKIMSRFNKRYFYSDNNSFFKVLCIIGKLYFNDISKTNVKDLFFIYKNEKHIKMYSECIKKAEAIENEEKYEKNVKKNIQIFINELQKENVLTRIKVVTFAKQFKFTFGKLSSKNNDEIQIKQFKSILYAAILQELPITIIKRDYTYLRIENKSVQKASAFSIVNGNSFSQKGELVKRIDKQNLKKYENELVVIYEDFNSKILNLLKKN